MMMTRTGTDVPALSLKEGQIRQSTIQGTVSPCQHAITVLFQGIRFFSYDDQGQDMKRLIEGRA